MIEPLPRLGWPTKASMIGMVASGGLGNLFYAFGWHRAGCWLLAACLIFFAAAVVSIYVQLRRDLKRIDRRVALLKKELGVE